MTKAGKKVVWTTHHMPPGLAKSTISVIPLFDPANDHPAPPPATKHPQMSRGARPRHDDEPVWLVVTIVQPTTKHSDTGYVTAPANAPEPQPTPSTMNNSAKEPTNKLSTTNEGRHGCIPTPVPPQTHKPRHNTELLPLRSSHHTLLPSPIE
ncbi:hypothetical protein BDZ97DRAFT_1925959 [Flammula alnicola]|nr:hypothetical protein BDZ97DRAFT_1925959 [Flammula alnicola]